MLERTRCISPLFFSRARLYRCRFRKGIRLHLQQPVTLCGDRLYEVIACECELSVGHGAYGGELSLDEVAKTVSRRPVFWIARLQREAKLTKGKSITQVKRDDHPGNRGRHDDCDEGRREGHVDSRFTWNGTPVWDTGANSGKLKKEKPVDINGLQVVLVERRRIELPTFALRTRRSPS